MTWHPAWATALFVLSGCQSAIQPLVVGRGENQVIVTAGALTGPALQVDIESRNARALLSLVAENGSVATWVSIDNISISLDQGVLVASRGLGFDLMGADAQGTLDALAGTDGSVYRRQMRYLDGEQHSSYVMAGCSMATAGSEVMEGQRVNRFEESCKARDNEFTNVFWLGDDRSVVQSRQWLSPEVGYIVTIRKR